MTEDAFGRPMLDFSSTQTPETPNDSAQGGRVADPKGREMAELMFPSMKTDEPEQFKDPFEARREKLAQAEAEAAAEAEPVELTTYAPGDLTQDYGKVDVDNLALYALDAKTSIHIEDLRNGDYESVFEEILAEVVELGGDVAVERKYFEPLLDRLKGGEDPKALVDWATRRLLYYIDAKKAHQEGA